MKKSLLGLLINIPKFQTVTKAQSVVQIEDHDRETREGTKKKMKVGLSSIMRNIRKSQYNKVRTNKKLKRNRVVILASLSSVVVMMKKNHWFRREKIFRKEMKKYKLTIKRKC